MNPEVKAFFDEATNTVSYLVCEPGGRSLATPSSCPTLEPHGRTFRVEMRRSCIAL